MLLFLGKDAQTTPTLPPHQYRFAHMETEFHLDPQIVYLNNAAVAPWPTSTADAVKRFAEENARLGATCYPHWARVEQRLRERMARLINASSADDIALTKNTSEALSIVAHGLPWQAGDNCVSIAQEFPSNRMVWESLANQGVELRLLDLDQSIDPETDLIALCDKRTRLAGISAVQYARGLRLDLPRIGEHCRGRGILLCVDAIQQIGALPFDVQAIQADFAAADGHKWMLGPEGLALFYVRGEVREQLQLRQFGWHMVEHPGDFDRHDWCPASSARRFECGSPNMLAIHALDASLELIERTGAKAIAGRIAESMAQCQELCARAGYEVSSPLNPQRCAGIFNFRVPGLNPAALHPVLMRNQLICAHRGGGIRFSPHAYNTVADIERAFELVAEAVVELVHHS